MSKKILLLSLIFLSLANQSNAASLNLQSDVEKVRINSYFKVNVFLNSEDVSINTIEAKISFPKDLIQLKEIRNGNSIISFWVDAPKEEDDTITFSGIIPDGYNSKDGLISSFLFESENYGTGTIKIDSLKGFKNDGLGTPIDLTPANLTFYIVKTSDEFVPIEMEDYVKPESFTPEINQAPDMFNGEHFLVFATQDKGLGIDHYEVCEGDINNCVTANSPYLLKNQDLNDKIFVKAIDKKGNERLATLDLQKRSSLYGNYLFFAIIVLVILLILYLIKKTWIKFKK